MHKATLLPVTQCDLPMTYPFPPRLPSYAYYHLSISTLFLIPILSISTQLSNLRQETNRMMCVPSIPDCYPYAASYVDPFKLPVNAMLMPPALALFHALVMTLYNPG